VGPQRWAGYFEEDRILLLLPEFESWIIGPTACCYTDSDVPDNDQREEAKSYHVTCLNSGLYSSGGSQANFILSEPVNGKDLCA
jgi:hypothetical protein